MDIVTRQQAVDRGLTRYFTGKECRRGHVCERSVSDWSCLECRSLTGTTWRNENREKIHRQNREWKRKNAAKAKADDADWYKRNKERVRANEKRWRSENPEKRRALEKRYANKNRETIRAKVRARIARKKGAGSRFTGKQIQALFSKQKGKCAHEWCRAKLGKSYHQDHRTPLALGGSNDIKNIQLLCPVCNLKKGASHPVVFAQKNGMLL